MNRLIGNEIRYVEEVLSSEFRSSKGADMMTRLEKAFSEKFGVDYAISAVNGTATLHAILEAIGIGPGDEVIVPPLTMSSTAFAVFQANGTPIFADVDRDTFLIDAPSIEKRITPKTKAIITVALYGLSPDMDPIMDLAKKHDLCVIEDDAQCFLGKYKGRLVGTIGDASSFSFQSSKHITSGEGGMVITNNQELAKKIRMVNSLGYAGLDAGKAKITKDDIQNPNYSRHSQIGWNYRIPELCAAVALGQLENIEMLVNRRMEAAKVFDEVIADCAWLRPQLVPEHSVHSYWSYVVVLENDQIKWTDFRDKFMEFGGDGIYGAWQLTYLEPAFENKQFLGREDFVDDEIACSYKVGLCPNAEYLQPRLLQFKTNYWDVREVDKQLEALEKTIDFFDRIVNSI